MLIADAQRAVASQRLPQFEVGLIRIGILHIPVDGGEVQHHARRQRTRDVGKDRSRGLVGRKGNADLRRSGHRRRVAAREKCIGERPQGDSIIKQPKAATNHRSLRVKWRPGESGARRDVVRVGIDRLQELKVVADSEIQREARAHLPFVLCVNAEIRIGLRYYSRPA